jgi:subfamily B ATP-binding cassette protein MsbA
MINDYFKKIFRFAKPYKKYMYLNIFFNILYALFSALSFLTLMPMLDVLFKNGNEIIEKPVYKGITNTGDYLKDYLGYWITNSLDKNGSLNTLMILIAVIITTFLLKNLFNYWAMYFITFLRNGVLKDIRNTLYKKTVELPLSYFF